MNVERLIEVVRDYDELYDMSHPKYCDVFHKERLWNLIGTELNQTGSVCRTRWNNIRDNYRKCLRKRARENGQTSGKATKYRFEDELSFLIPYYQNLDTTLTGSDTHPAEDSLQETENESYVEEKAVDTNPFESEPLASYTRKRALPVSVECVSTKKKTSEATVATLVKYLIEKGNAEENNAKRLTDPVDAFLAGLAPTLKALPPYYLNIAKTKMFAAVQELELACIMEQKTDPIGVASSTAHSLPDNTISPSQLIITNHLTPQIKKELRLSSEIQNKTLSPDLPS